MHFTSNYISSCNSPTERVHSTVVAIEILQSKDEIPQNLMISAVLTYNLPVHSSTVYIPFSLLCGPSENGHDLDFDKKLENDKKNVEKGNVNNEQ